MTRLRNTRPVSQGSSRAFMLAVGLAGLGVAVLLAWIGFNAPNSIPGRQYYDLTAELRQADNLTSHYQVRLNGSLVGQVLNPRVENGLAVVDLQLDKRLEPLRSDTRLRVRPRSPIGVRFVEIYPGTRGRPLRQGERLPASQSSASLPLDTALSTLDPRTRERTRALLGGLGTGFAARGDDLNEAIAGAPGMLSDTESVMGAISARGGAAERFVLGARGAAVAADPVRDVIASGFEPEARALRPFSDRRAALSATLRDAPGALAGVRDGLARSRPLIAEAGGLARDALPALRAAPAALAQTSALLRDGRPSVERLDRTLELAQRSVAPTLSLLTLVRPVLPDLEQALALARPPLEDLGPRRCDMLLMLRNWESMLAWGNEGGNYLRFNVISPTPESASGQTGSAPSATPIRSNPYPAPCETSARKGGA